MIFFIIKHVQKTITMQRYMTKPATNISAKGCAFKKTSATNTANIQPIKAVTILIMIYNKTPFKIWLLPLFIQIPYNYIGGIYMTVYISIDILGKQLLRKSNKKTQSNAFYKKNYIYMYKINIFKNSSTYKYFSQDQVTIWIHTRRISSKFWIS